MTHCTFRDTNVFLYFSKFDRNRGSHWMLRQLLKFHPFDCLIEIDLQTEDQGTHHKIVSFQLIPGFPPLSERKIFGHSTERQVT